MSKRIFVLGVICILCLSFSSCDWLAAKVAELVLDGAWQETYTSYNAPRFEGYVKSTGNGTAYNAKIDITCYSDTGKTTIIEVASGFPADLGDIPPDTRAYFEAVCFTANSHNDIKATDHAITWLDKD